MTTKAKSPDPPIFTADHKRIDLGMTVFGVDTACSKDRVPKIEILHVIQIDLGRSRSIRLRRSNGTEYTWTAQESRKFCRTSEQFVYAHRKNAKTIARKAAHEQLAKILKEDFDGEGSLSKRLAEARSTHVYEQEQIRKEHRKMMKVANAYKTKIKAIK